MDRPAELDLALDVDHVTLADARAGGDPRRLPERVVAQLDHGETVDLADLLAGGVDQDRRSPDRLQHALADPAGTLALLVDGMLYILGCHRFATRTVCAIAGLAQQIDDRAQANRELLCVARQACRVLDHARDRPAVEGPQRFLVNQSR